MAAGSDMLEIDNSFCCTENLLFYPSVSDDVILFPEGTVLCVLTSVMVLLMSFVFWSDAIKLAFLCRACIRS